MFFGSRMQYTQKTSLLLFYCKKLVKILCTNGSCRQVSLFSHIKHQSEPNRSNLKHFVTLVLFVSEHRDSKSVHHKHIVNKTQRNGFRIAFVFRRSFFFGLDFLKIRQHHHQLERLFGIAATSAWCAICQTLSHKQSSINCYSSIVLLYQTFVDCFRKFPENSIMVRHHPDSILILP